MKAQIFISAASAMFMAGSNFAAAQDDSAAFVTKCAAGQWALTFDDGPSPFTASLLQTLKTAGVPATFFVLGVQLEDPELAKATKAAFDAGHQIASHTYNHSDLNTLTPAQITDQMNRAAASIKTVTGSSPKYMRPPYGNCGVTCQGVMKQLGYVVSTWDVDSNDWRVVGTPNEAKAFDAFSTALGSRDATSGHISLQHDIHQFSVQMVPKIIAAIKEKGFKFVTVDKCAGGSIPAYREENAPIPGAVGNGTTATNATNIPTPVTPVAAARVPTPTTAPINVASSASMLSASSLSVAVLAVAAVACI